jgi:hypothetical protein
MIRVHFVKFEIEWHGLEAPASLLALCSFFLAFLLELPLVGKN